MAEIKAPCGCLIDRGTGQVTVYDSCVEHKKPPKASLMVRILPRSAQEALARRSLESKLAFNLNAARAHEKNGRPKGHGAYVLLYNESLENLDAYGAEFRQHADLEQRRNDLFAHYPAMYDLKKFATQAAPGAVKAHKVSPGLVLVAAIVLPVLLGAGSGLYHGAQQLILKLLGGS